LFGQKPMDKTPEGEGKSANKSAKTATPPAADRPKLRPDTASPGQQGRAAPTAPAAPARAPTAPAPVPTAGSQQPPMPPKPGAPPAPSGAAPLPRPQPETPQPQGAAEAIAARKQQQTASGSTADPSVKTGNMFKLDGDAKRLLDDPYADLIKGHENNSDQKAPVSAGGGGPQKR